MFRRRVPKPTRVSFHYGCPNFLVNAVLPRFLQVQDIFYILASLVQIQEMMLWSMLAPISLPCSSGVWQTNYCQHKLGAEVESSRTQFEVLGLGLVVCKFSKMPCPPLEDGTFFDLGAKTFFFGDHFLVLSLVLSLGFKRSCSWPRKGLSSEGLFLALALASSFVFSTPPLVRGAIIRSGAPNQFLILFTFCFNGDASTRFLLLVFETFM